MSKFLKAIHIAISCVCATKDLDDVQKTETLRYLESLENIFDKMIRCDDER